MLSCDSNFSHLIFAQIKSIESLEEDIFGSMSDDSEKMNDPKLSKLSVSDVYDADSDSSNKDVRENESMPKEESKFSKINADLGMPLLNSTDKPNNSYENFFEHMKPKKKKRKKSKEEKSSKHHHHHHHHHHHNHHHPKPVEKVEVSPPPPPFPLPSENVTPSVRTSQTFEFDEQAEKTPKDDELPDAPKDGKVLHQVHPQEAVDIVTSSIVAESINEEIKEVTKPVTVKNEDEVEAVKSISNSTEEMPNERIVADVVSSSSAENIHERAVMSISQALTVVPNTDVVEPPVNPVTEKPPNAGVEDKTGITISQEETEDAIAAILGESSEFTPFSDCYAGDAMKPDTPGSDRGLQIDTDVEEMGTSTNKSDAEDLLEEDLKCSSDDSFVTVGRTDTTSDEPSRNVTTPTSSSKDISINSVSEVNTSTTSSCFTTPEKPPSLEPEVSLDDSKSQESAEKSVLVDTSSSDTSKSETSTSVSDLVKSKPLADDSTKSALVSVKSPLETEVPMKTLDKPNMPNLTEDHFLPNLCKKDSDLDSLKADEKVEELVKTPNVPVIKPENESIPKIDTVTPAPEVSKESIAETPKPEMPPIIEPISEKNVLVKEKRTYNNCIIPPKSSHHLPNNIVKVGSDRTVLAKVEPPSTYFKNVVPPEPPKVDPIKVNEVLLVDGVTEAKRNERKRSYAECNGPSHPNAVEKERFRPNNSSFPVSPVEVRKLELQPKVVEPVEKVVVEPTEPTKPILIENKSLNETAKEAPIICEKEVESLPSLSDHTYNSIIKKPSTTSAEPSVEYRVAKESPFRSVIMERVTEIDPVAKVVEKEEPLKVAMLDDSKPTVVTDTDLALKQKLPIPAQQNTEMVDNKEKERTHTEVNEANKENIVKTAINQDNVSESIEDTRSNVILKDKEITRTVEDEIFKGVANDFTKCNHKVPENNRNILEKVVQRIHESKRTVQKIDDCVPSAIVANVTPSPAPDKVALATEEEITSAEILLKMSESTVVKAQVSDYNCVLKVNHEPDVLDSALAKSEEKDSSFEAIKNESVSSCDLQGESNEDTAELTDDAHGAETGT